MEIKRGSGLFFPCEHNRANIRTHTHTHTHTKRVPLARWHSQGPRSISTREFPLDANLHTETHERDQAGRMKLNDDDDDDDDDVTN